MDARHISWIATGWDRIDILIGVGIDGRGAMPAVFDGLASDHAVIPVRLVRAKTFDSGAVWLRYRV